MTRYLPTLVTATCMIALYVAQNRGILTGDQVLALIAALGLGGTAMAPPVRGGRS